MRQQSHSYGYLASNQYENGVDDGGYVEVEPLNLTLPYVPFYDPRIVFFVPHPGFFIGGALRFGPTIAMGTSFGAYGWFGAGFGWSNHALLIDYRPWGRTWVNRRVYVHAYVHAYARPVGPRVEHHEEHGEGRHPYLSRSATGDVRALILVADNLDRVKFLNRRLTQAAFSLAIVLITVIVIDYCAIPSGDTAQSHFDTLIVLGTSAEPDGSPSPEQHERVLEGIRQYRSGTAQHLIMTGGAAHNPFIEAHVMAKFATSQGIPASAILEEDQALNTIQNVFYSAEIMHQHGWSSAEIISSPSHLPRASLIVQTFDREQPLLAIRWHTRAASWPPAYSLLRRLTYYSVEATYCLRLRLLGFPRSRFLPGN